MWGEVKYGGVEGDGIEMLRPISLLTGKRSIPEGNEAKEMGNENTGELWRTHFEEYRATKKKRHGMHLLNGREPATRHGTNIQRREPPRVSLANESRFFRPGQYKRWQS